MIRLKTVFSDVKPETLYDVLHDPDYRKVEIGQIQIFAKLQLRITIWRIFQTWDKHMLESKELGMLNPNNDLSYYAIHCPAPVKNRDFVLQVFFWNFLILFGTLWYFFLHFPLIFCPMTESHIIYK